MREYKLSTARGKKLYDMGCRYDGYTLGQVYDTWSQAKQNAFDYCFNEYRNTENSIAFSICSHNLFAFTCSWLGTKDGENIMRIETRDNSYLIWLDR